MPSTAIGLILFNFTFEYLKRLQRSETLHTKMNPTTTCLDHGLYRILSSYWLAHFYLMKKSDKVLRYLFWFGLRDVG